MSLIARFKRDIGKHRGRSAILGVLFVTMIVMTVRAVLELKPQPLAASTLIASTSIEQPLPVANSAEADARINESTRLWHALREVKPGAADVALAFAFDASQYERPPEVSRHITPVAADPEPVAKPTPVATAIDTEAMKAAQRATQIREQARSLVVKTTSMGNGTTKPMAIVNQQLLMVGQEILGFELSAIRPREVEFVKEGVSVVVKMPEGQ